MKLEGLTSIDRLTDFLAGTQAVAFSVVIDKDASDRHVIHNKQKRADKVTLLFNPGILNGSLDAAKPSSTCR